MSNGYVIYFPFVSYKVQVNNYEIVENFSHVIQNLTWYSAIVHKFARIYPVMNWQNNSCKKLKKLAVHFYGLNHGLRTPREEIAFTARPKIHSHSQIFRYGRSIFCLPHRPKFSDFFDLCLHWVSVVRGLNNLLKLYMLSAYDVKRVHGSN